MACRGDAATIARFNRRMAVESEGRGLDAATVQAGVIAVLDDPRLGFYVVAEEEKRVVGALLVTFEWSDWRNGQFWWIQSVFVVPEHRRQGVYATMHAFVGRRARAQQGVCGLRLYVEKDNAAAQNVYRSTGMAETAYRLYEEEF
jgi:GNAT superfamily N-acetyltransferase